MDEKLTDKNSLTDEIARVGFYKKQLHFLLYGEKKSYIFDDYTNLTCIFVGFW